jgi:hypothetical protein
VSDERKRSAEATTCNGCALAREEGLEEYECMTCGAQWGPQWGPMPTTNPRTSDATDTYYCWACKDTGCSECENASYAQRGQCPSTHEGTRCIFGFGHRVGYHSDGERQWPKEPRSETPQDPPTSTLPDETEERIRNLAERITREPHFYAGILVAYQDAACAVLDEFHSGAMAAKSGVPGQTLKSKAMRKVWVAYKTHCLNGRTP